MIEINVAKPFDETNEKMVKRIQIDKFARPFIIDITETNWCILTCTTFWYN